MADTSRDSDGDVPHGNPHWGGIRTGRLMRVMDAAVRAMGSMVPDAVTERTRPLFERLLPARFSRHALVGSPQLWRMKRQFQIAFLVREGLRPLDRFCDLGCGTLRGGIPIIRYLEPEHYWGIDVRQDILVEAQKELQREGLCEKVPQLIHGTELVELDVKFDFIWAFSTLIHMTDHILSEALEFVRRHLKAEGRFYANVVLDPEHRGQWREFPLVGRRLEDYEKISAARALTLHDMGTLRSLGHVSGRSKQDSQHMLAMKHMREDP